MSGRNHLLTDITYLYYGNGQKAYLSYVKDGATREIVAHVVTTSLKMNIVYQTLKQLSSAVDEFHPEALIHSDQGFHYTHPEFQSKVKQMDWYNQCRVGVTAGTMLQWNLFLELSKIGSIINLVNP